MGPRGGLGPVENKNALLLQGFQPQFLGRPVCILVTLPTELSRSNNEIDVGMNRVGLQRCEMDSLAQYRLILRNCVEHDDE
jgi:hypothetical protein